MCFDKHSIFIQYTYLIYMYSLRKICIRLSCSDVHKTVVFAYALSYNYLNTTRTSGKTSVWVSNWRISTQSEKKTRL